MYCIRLYTKHEATNNLTGNPVNHTGSPGTQEQRYPVHRGRPDPLWPISPYDTTIHRVPHPQQAKLCRVAPSQPTPAGSLLAAQNRSWGSVRDRILILIHCGSLSATAFIALILCTVIYVTAVYAVNPEAPLIRSNTPTHLTVRNVQTTIKHNFKLGIEHGQPPLRVCTYILVAHYFTA